MDKKHLYKNPTRRMKAVSIATGILFTLLLVGLFRLSLIAQTDTTGSTPADTVTASPINDTTQLDQAAQTDTLVTDSLVNVETTAENTEPANAEPTFIAGEYTKQQKRRGERLFNGLVPFESGLHNCASCHYTEPQEDINWNPAALEMALLWEGNPDYSILDIMNNPVSVRLMEDHAGMSITEEEQHLLEAYYTQLIYEGPSDLHAYPVRAAIFWGLGALMLLAIIDLIFTRKIPFKAIHIAIIFVGLAVHGQYAMAEAQRLGRTQDYAPDQPIKFSHLIHAGENEIDCEYCHFTVERSLSANFPSNNVCLNCHTVVRNGTNSGSFEINKIHRALDNGQPVEWIRIHKLPDHSFFSHSQHVNAGQLECTECHGEVETMHILHQVEDLSMGWCLTCHRDNDVNFANNPYFETYHKLLEKIENGEIEGIKAADLGGENCMSCHY